ncbi:MAG: 3-methyladenine DNA glycosylase, partial [Ignavibacteria bacterium]
AVLLRAVEPVEGIDLMVRNREWTGIGKSQTAGHFRDPQKGNQRAIPPNLTNGPAKLCQAFGIERNQNGTDLLGGLIFLARGEYIPSSEISSSPRIGIKNGREKKWRFYVKGNPFISK